MPDDLMLQRWLSRRDGWMDVLPFDAAESQRVQDAAAALAGSCGGVAWRILRVHPPRTVLAVYEGRRWQATGEEQLAPDVTTEPMPWYQPAAALARLLDRDRRAFADTTPIHPPSSRT